MKKILLCCLGCVLAIFCARASSDIYRSVVITKSDDSCLAIEMNDCVTSEVKNGEFVIQGSKSCLSLPVVDVKKFTFSPDPGLPLDKLSTSISDADAALPVVIFADEVLTIHNLPDDTSVTLSDISGRRVFSALASGSYTLSLTDLTRGIYVLSYGKESIKLAVK